MAKGMERDLDAGLIIVLPGPGVRAPGGKRH
jgi:hypothetical protein